MTDSDTEEVKRIHSKNVEHLQSDLQASLVATLPTAAQRHRGLAIVSSLKDYRDSQEALREVLAAFGPIAFGSVLLFHIENETSLAGHAESMTVPTNLAKLGLRVADLGWPREVLHPKYQEEMDRAAKDPSELTVEEHEREMARIGAVSRLAFARKQHPELVKAEAQARVNLAAAIMAMDEAADQEGRHNLFEQAAVETALQEFGRALADLVRGEADSTLDS